VRKLRTAAAVALVGGLVSAIPVATTAAADTSGPYFGYATGTIIHADALQQASTRLANAEVAQASAVVGSAGFTGGTLNEMLQPVRPKAAKGDRSYGRGSSVEAGLNQTTPNDPDANQLKLPSTVSEAGAPPSTPLVTNEVLKLPANQLVYASLLRSRAQANWNNDTCILGQPISFGQSYAVDAQLVSATAANPDGTLNNPLLAVDAPNPERAVSQSTSFTYLVSNGDGTFGLGAETHETIAPITILRGTANQTTIEFLGEWVLRTYASGTAAKGATVFYGPGAVSPETPILRLLDKDGKVTKILNTQDLFGPGKLPTTVNVPGVLELTIGENPRAIGGPANSSPTQGGAGLIAAAAVDVVRVRLLDGQAVRLGDIRIGHMESSVTTPAGGIECPLPVKKDVDKNPVTRGDVFTWTISIPRDAHALDGIDCQIVNISAIDTARGGRMVNGVFVPSDDVKFTLTGASNGGSVNDATKTVTWSALGPYQPGDPPIRVTISGKIADSSGAGVIEDLVKVTANLGNCKGGASGTQLVGIAKLTNVSLTGQFTLHAPDVVVILGAQAKKLPRTGGRMPVAFAVALLMTAAVLRGLTLRTRPTP
jgi:hypothetical protein